MTSFFYICRQDKKLIFTLLNAKQLWQSWWRHYRHYLSDSIFSASFGLISYLEGETPRNQGVCNINAQHIIKLKTFEKLKGGSIVPPSETPLRWAAFYIDMNEFKHSLNPLSIQSWNCLAEKIVPIKKTKIDLK